MPLDPTFLGQYNAIVRAIGQSTHAVIDYLVKQKVIDRGRVTISKRVDELVKAGVLEKRGARPTYFKVADTTPLEAMAARKAFYRRAALGAPQEPAQEAQDNPAVTEPEAPESTVEAVFEAQMASLDYDNLWPQLEPIFNQWIEGYAEAWTHDIADLQHQLKERDQRIAELEAKLAQARELFA